MRTPGILLAVCIVLVVPLRARQVTIRQTPIQKTSWASGQEMYRQYCSACHGNSGKGDGPAAAAFKAPVADLTTLTQRNRGKFPYGQFDAVMRFGAKAASHGARSDSAHSPENMPVWEPLFASLPNEREGTIHQRISNLAHYVATMQSK